MYIFLDVHQSTKYKWLFYWKFTEILCQFSVWISVPCYISKYYGITILVTSTHICLKVVWCTTNKNICRVLLYTYHSSHLHILVVGENENDVAQFDAFWTPERAGEKSDEDTGGHEARAGPPLTEARARHEAKIRPKSAQTRDLCACPETRSLSSTRRLNCSTRGARWDELRKFEEVRRSVCHMTSAWYNSWYIHTVIVQLSNIIRKWFAHLEFFFPWHKLCAC